MKFVPIFLMLIGLTSMDLCSDAIKKDPKELIDSQIAMMDDLIAMTKQTLNGEYEIKTLIQDYQHIQDAYLKNMDDKELVIKMVRTAHQVLTKIQENHLLQQFDPDFISELTLFSKIATKKGIPKP